MEANEDTFPLGSEKVPFDSPLPSRLSLPFPLPSLLLPSPWPSYFLALPPSSTPWYYIRTAARLTLHGGLFRAQKQNQYVLLMCLVIPDFATSSSKVHPGSEA